MLIKATGFLLVSFAILVSILSTDCRSTSETEPVELKYPAASCVILLEEDRMNINSAREAYLDYRIVKKIIKAGCPEEGYFGFPEDAFRSIVSIEAKVIYPDGSEKKISGKDIKKVPAFNDELYGDSVVRAFRVPSLSPGTIIDVSVRTKLNNLIYWGPVSFGRTEPVVKRRCRIVHPREATFRINGMNMPDEPDTVREIGQGRLELTWERNDIAPLTPEQGMPPLNNYVPTLYFTPLKNATLGAFVDLSSWKGIITWYRDLCADKLEAGPEIRKAVAGLKLDELAEQERAERIFRFVQSNIRYVAIYFGIGGHEPHRAEEILRNRYGDCKDQSVLLASMLREARVPAYLVPVRTADRGIFEEPFPIIWYFNHVIVAAIIGERILYLDPVCGSCSFGVLPEMDQGAHALLIRETESDLIKLPAGMPRKNVMAIKEKVSIDARGSAHVEDTIVFDGYFAANMRKRTAVMDTVAIREYAKSGLLGRAPSAVIHRVELAGATPEDSVVTIILQYRIPEYCALSRNPTLLPAVTYAVRFDLPPDGDRMYPWQIGVEWNLKYDLSLEMPPEWETAVANDTVSYSSRYFDYCGVWENNGNRLGFKRSFLVKNGSVEPKAFSEIRKSLAAIMKREEERILVSKRVPGLPAGDAR